ncbi:MAG: hypothetical protein JW746_00510 [Candidatus Krumholzibacteriota bacterium]|nr:hypothetical protein [Candidatus Krumholzibacteriota bacterium]
MKKREKKRSVVPGLILICIGIVAVLGNFGLLDLDWEVLWTYFILVLGIIFWLGFIFDRSKDGLIMPGTVLLTYGVIFNLSARFRWVDMDDLWPFFILGPAFGFFAMYLFGKRHRGLLVPAVILTVVGGIFLLQNYVIIKYIWPPILVIIGVLVLMKKKDSEEDEIDL